MALEPIRFVLEESVGSGGGAGGAPGEQVNRGRDGAGGGKKDEPDVGWKRAIDAVTNLTGQVHPLLGRAAELAKNFAANGFPSGKALAATVGPQIVAEARGYFSGRYVEAGVVGGKSLGPENAPSWFTSMFGAGGRAAASGAGGTGASGAGGAALAAGGGAAALVPPILALTAVIGGGIVATKLLIDANNALRASIDRQADRLRPFSAAIQQSDAQNQVAQLRLDMRQAQVLGPRIAEFNNSQARMDRGIQRIVAAVEGPFLDRLNPLLERIAAAIEGTAKDSDDKAIKVSQAFDILRFIYGDMRGVRERLGRLVGLEEAKKELEQTSQDLLGLFPKPNVTVMWNGTVYGEGSADGVGQQGKTDRDRIPFGRAMGPTDGLDGRGRTR